MKVLIVCKACTSLAYQLKFEEISKLGNIEIFLVVPEKYGNLNLERSKSDLINILPKKVFFSKFSHVNFYKGIRNILEDIKPDLCHVDEEYYKFAAYQWIRILRRYNIKSFFYSWQNIFKNYPPPFSWMEKFNFRHSCLAVVGNQEAKDVLRNKGFEKKVEIIPQFGVDNNIFKKNNVDNLKAKLGLDKFIIGFMGRFVKEKGIYILLESLNYIEKDIQLIFVGGGPEKGNMLSFIENNNLSNKVKVIDSVSSTEVVKYLNLMDVMVLPSITTKRWKEQFGRVLIEAMACEVPVIGSDSGEIPNVIGDAGLVFKENNIDDLAENINSLLSNGGLRKSIIKKGIQRVNEHYSQRIITQKYHKVYTEVFNMN